MTGITINSQPQTLIILIIPISTDLSSGSRLPFHLFPPHIGNSYLAMKPLVFLWWPFGFFICLQVYLT